MAELRTRRRVGTEYRTTQEHSGPSRGSKRGGGHLAFTGLRTETPLDALAGLLAEQRPTAADFSDRLSKGTYALALARSITNFAGVTKRFIRVDWRLFLSPGSPAQA